jgi:hypothetical protein
MKLEVHERIALLNILPKEGDFATLKTLRRAREMIGFSPDEVKMYGMSSGAGPDGKLQTSWDGKKAAENIKDCPVDEFTTNLIRDKLQELSKKRKLTDEYYSLYEKFIISYQ